MVEIVIDDSVMCIKCGKPGAVNNGICLKCAEGQFKERREAVEKEKINDKVIARVMTLINEHLNERKKSIDQAFKKFQPKPFDMAIKVQMVDTRDGISMMVGLSFMHEPKPTWQKEDVVSPDQMDLFTHPVHAFLDHIDEATGEVLADNDLDIGEVLPDEN